MDKAELLTEFRDRVDEFERYQTFITKAQSQSSKFAPAVVEKVIKDNTEKSMVVVEQIIPLLTDLDEVVATLGAEKQKVLDGRQTSQFALEELELRLAIGEMTDEEFESESSSLRDAVGSIDARVGVIDKELNEFKGVMERWRGLGEQAGVFQPNEVEPDPEPLDEDDDEDDDEVVPDDEELEAFDDSGRESAHVETAHITEDLSAVFGEAETIEATDDRGLGDIDILGDDGDIEVEAGGAEEEIAVGGAEEARRAVLLYQEGTPEEQIYPFNGDEITLGRGRDNDIQVKNDSKVSRYHCKLYRRGPNFYIEDNKSANGSLVNGELITERRLFGGEEIIIGETFFRFRIMD